MAYRTILIPLDGSELWQAALDAALPLAKALGARAVLCSIFDCAPERFDVYYDSHVPGEFKKEVRAHQGDVLKRAGEQLLAEGVESTTVTHEGDPVPLILEQAHQDQADLIVMASRGRKGLPRFLLGSVTDGVLRQAGCPVLVVHPPEEPGAAAADPEACS